MIRSAFAVFLALGLAGSAVGQAGHSLLTFSELSNWEAENHEDALEVFRQTCGDIKGPDWQVVCDVAWERPDAKLYFETFFAPVVIRDDEQALFTGYFEPELTASRTQTPKYRYPLYARPEEAPLGQPWLSREVLETTDVLKGRGLELAWVEDPVEVFYLQIQGSGRLRLTDGTLMRVGYGGGNGHPYRSVGKELIRQEIMLPHEVSAEGISDWVRENPVQGREMLWHNPSYVFFRNVSEVPSHQGPLGAMNRPLTGLRTIAVDPSYVQLGAPVWIEKGGVEPLNRVMVAQDTGAAIKGAQRADIFFGTGDSARLKARQVRDSGQMVVLLPRALALAAVLDD